MKTGEINYIDIIKAHEGSYADDDTYEVIQGRGRYNKVVATAKFGSSRRAVAFIDRTTGSMFKAASWSAPAKTRLA